MNIITEVLAEHPSPFGEEFKAQFKTWAPINIHGNIDPVDLKLRQIGAGSDRIVYQTKHPEILLKVAFGPQYELSIPLELEDLFLPYFEFRCPVPLQDPFFQDGRTYGQFQVKVNVPPYPGTEYMATRALNKTIQRAGIDIGFAKAVIEHYSMNKLDLLLEEAQKDNGPRINTQNWGYLGGKPVVFDYGRIIEKEGN